MKTRLSEVRWDSVARSIVISMIAAGGTAAIAEAREIDWGWGTIIMQGVLATLAVFIRRLAADPKKKPYGTPS